MAAGTEAGLYMEMKHSIEIARDGPVLGRAEATFIALTCFTSGPRCSSAGAQS